MAKEFEIVDIWLAWFGSDHALEAYMEESYGEDEEPISQFASDQSEWFYDHDFVEAEHYSKTPDDPVDMLKLCSFSSSYFSEAKSAFLSKVNKGSHKWDSVILVFGEEIESPRDVVRIDRGLLYLGRFTSDTKAEPVSIGDA